MVKTIKQLKTKLVNFKVTDQLFQKLQSLADNHEEGNVSVYLRKLISRMYSVENNDAGVIDESGQENPVLRGS